MKPGNLSDAGCGPSGLHKPREEIWLVWFPSLLAAAVIAVLYLISGLF